MRRKSLWNPQNEVSSRSIKIIPTTYVNLRFALIPLILGQNFKYLLRKPIREMLESAQFLHILAAEAEHLVTVMIFLPHESKSDLEQKLNTAFSSDSFSEAARAWNIERSRVTQDVIEQHFVPLGSKWVREYLREEVEDFLSQSCAAKLRKVCSPSL